MYVLAQIDNNGKTIHWRIAQGPILPDIPITKLSLRNGFLVNICWSGGLPTPALQEKANERIADHLERLILKNTDKIWP